MGGKNVRFGYLRTNLTSYLEAIILMTPPDTEVINLELRLEHVLRPKESRSISAHVLSILTARSFVLMEQNSNFINHAIRD